VSFGQSLDRLFAQTEHPRELSEREPLIEHANHRPVSLKNFDTWHNNAPIVTKIQPEKTTPIMHGASIYRSPDFLKSSSSDCN